MMQASGTLSQAVSNLRQEIETTFSGNAYYMAAAYARELADIVGAGAHGSRGATGQGFSAALEAVKDLARAELSENSFYLASHKLDVLAFIAAREGITVETAPAERADMPLKEAAPSEIVVPSAPSEEPPRDAPSEANGAGQGRNFDDLATASAARLREAAQAIGVPLTPASQDAHAEAGFAEEPQEPSPFAAEPVHAAAQPETLADGELERRSSEPCDMPPVEPAQPEQRDDPSGIYPAGSADAGAAEAAPDLGSPDIAAGVAEPDARPEPRTAAPEEEPAKAPAPTAAPADAAETASAGQTVKPAEVAAPAASAAPSRPKVQKPLFMLWLDILFGKKREDK